MADLNTFVVRDAVTIRDGILRVIRNGLVGRGVDNPNVTPGSDWFIRAQGVANQLMVAEANALVKVASMMPDTATGEDLERICSVFNITKQAAAGSVGSIVISTSANTTIATGTQLIDGAGLSYEVTTGGTYSDGDTVPIRAIINDPFVDSGYDTNHAEGDVLRWVATPPFSDSKVTVASGGLVNGIDAEGDEALRARLYSKLQEPPGSGNAEHVAELAEAASPSVQKAFVYPAAEGPGTDHTAVTAAPTDTNKSRVVASVIVSGGVAPYVQGKLAEHAQHTVTSVTDVNADVAFGLTIPEAATASPPGAGGGWVNGTPWPAPDESTTFRCTVTGVTSTTVFTVDAQTSPTVGVSEISWLSPFDWTLRSALVVAVSGTAGAYTITLDKPFVGIATGCYIWPNCQNAQSYVDATLAQFALMGPGEKTINASLLGRAFRHPRPAAGWPMTLGSHLLRALTTAQSEIDAAQFFHRTDGTTTLAGSAGAVTPQVPGVVTSPPNIFVPRHIAFYRIP